MKKIISSVLDVEVSYFKNIKDTIPTTVNLLDILHNTNHKAMVESVRKIHDEDLQKEAKAKIPCITPSGMFSVRNEMSLLKHSGFIQFDIDQKDNLEIENFAELKDQIRKIANVAFVGLSVRGVGCWGLIPIADPSKHKEYFKFIEKYFKSLGIQIDPYCKDVVRLRILSYDPGAYFNHEAVVLRIEHTIDTVQKKEKTFYTSHPDNNKNPLLSALIDLISKRSIDITEGYGQWFNLGCYLNNVIEGRTIFHQMSSYNPKYTCQETDNQFNQCRTYAENYTVGTMISICKARGITIVPGYMVCYNDEYTLIGAENFQMDESEIFSVIH